MDDDSDGGLRFYQEFQQYEQQEKDNEKHIISIREGQEGFWPCTQVQDEPGVQVEVRRPGRMP